MITASAPLFYKPSSIFPFTKIPECAILHYKDVIK